MVHNVLITCGDIYYRSQNWNQTRLKQKKMSSEKITRNSYGVKSNKSMTLKWDITV